MKILLMRHGETDWNAKNLVLGRTDIPLNDNGKRQAETAAKLLLNTNIDIIFTSPLIRAIETGRIVQKFQKSSCRCEVANNLIEQDFGIYEGVNRNDLEYQSAKRVFFSRYKGGESYSDVVARVYPFIEELLKKENENVLIVTHGGICRVIVNYFRDMENEEFASFKTGNCEIIKLL